MTIEITDEMVTKIHAKIYGNCCPPGCNCDGNQWERREVKHFLTAALPIIEQAVRADERERCAEAIEALKPDVQELIVGDYQAGMLKGLDYARETIAARIVRGQA